MLFFRPNGRQKGVRVDGAGLVRRSRGRGATQKEESADDLIAKYAKDAPPPPPPEVKLSGELPKAAGGNVDFPAVFRAAGIDDGEQGRIDKATQLLKTLPAETPKDVKKQIVEASLKAFGYPVEQIIEAGAQEIQALEVYIQAGQRDTQALLAESQKRMRRARGGDRAHQEGDGGSGGGAVRADAGVQCSKSCGCRRCSSSSGRKRSRALFLNHRSCTSPKRARNEFGNKRSRHMAEGAGFFSRLSNLWKGFVSLWISDIEKEHPEIAYENAINSMIEKYSKLKKATAAIIRRREEVSERLTMQSKELAQVTADLSVAVETNQDDLAVVLIQKKNALEKEVAELKADLDTAQKDADSAKASLMTVQGEIKKLKAEKDNMLAKMASAQARIRINDQLEGLSVDAEVKALDNVREHIKNTIAQANLGAELKSTDLDQRLGALRAQSGDVTAKQQLAEMKAAAAAKKASQKTM